MNYLAHLHLAHSSKTNLLGNFLGDFVKGSAFSHLDDDLQHGIMLHRKIDTFTDRHDVIIELRRSFPKPLRRMSGVMLDIYFDHLLCLNWQYFSDESLDTVLAAFYQDLANSTILLPGRFDQVREGLLLYQWLANYQQQSTCLNAFLNIEKRLNNRVKFAQDGYAFIGKNESSIHSAFLIFYPQLMAYVKEKSTEALHLPDAAAT